MLIKQPPMTVETSHHICAFHRVWPTQKFAGCTCSGSYSAKVKPIEEWTKEERLAYFGIEELIHE